MRVARIPHNEQARLRALEQYAILDTASETSFDAITTLAARILERPIAMVSIVDADRQWCKSCFGMQLRQTPRDISFCSHVVADEGPLIVGDAAADERFSDNPLVLAGPRLRSYAGMPLVTTDGFVLGTLAAIDREPRAVTDKQLGALELLAGQTVALLDLRRQTRLLAGQSDALAHRELQLRAILDTAVDAIITIDKSGLIEAVNPAVERLFGYSPPELIGQNVSILMPSPHRERHDGYLSAYERTGQRRVIGVGREVLARRKDGSSFPADLAVSQLELGEGRRFTGVIRDLSERRRIEQLKDDFVSTVSHELRTPLTSLRGSLGLVASGVTGELPPQARAHIQMALSNAKRLGRLISDVLDLEKIRSGRLDSRRNVVRLSTLIEQAIAVNDAFAASYQIRLELDGDLPDVDVVVDEDRLNQVLSNLIANAVTFSPADWPVEVSVRVGAARVRVSVRDYGPGVPEQFRARIFQRFAQADSSNRRSKAGTGLGLSISKSLIEGMNGQIGFEAAEGGGTRFFIELPWLPPVALSEASGAALALVCEPDLDVAHSLRAVVEQAALSVVHVAPTEDRARELLAKFAYGLVVLDLELAQGSASSLISGIRSNPATRAVPIVVVSAGGAQTPDMAGLLVIDILPQRIDVPRLLEAARTACVLTRTERCRALHIESDGEVRQTLSTALAEVCQLTGVEDVAHALPVLSGQHFDLVLLDLESLESAGPALLGKLGEAQVILFSAAASAQALASRMSRALAEAHNDEAPLRSIVALARRGRA
jgi:PAS domain S-box-containing protein